MMRDVLPAALDPYAELGLEPTACAAEIRQAYFSRVRAAGPERDPATFKRIRAAYEQLSSPGTRFEADMLRIQWVPPEPPRKPDWPAAVLGAARALSDLEGRSFREDFREVSL